MVLTEVRANDTMLAVFDGLLDVQCVELAAYKERIEAMKKAREAAGGRPICPYGVHCFRGNPAHRAKYYHPEHRSRVSSLLVVLSIDLLILFIRVQEGMMVVDDEVRCAVC